MLDASQTLTCQTAEYRLLGSLFTEPRAFDLIPFIDEGHFYYPAHARIFAALRRNYLANGPVTNLALMREFDGDPDFEAAGGVRPYLEGMVKNLSPYSHPLEDAKFVAETAQRRALHAALAAATAAVEGADPTPPAEVALALAKRFEDVSRGYGAPRVLDDYEVTERILEELRHDPVCYPTGLPKLDAAMDGGLHARKVYGFAARKKCGKTTLASTISCNLAQAGVRHLFITCEMSVEEVHQRNLSRLTDTYPSAFRTAYGRSPDFQRKVADVAVRSKRCVLYHSAPGITFDELRRSVVTAALQSRVTGFILDYWQLVGGKPKGRSTSEHLDEVAQWLADACRKHKLWGVVMAQLNQDGNTRGGEGIRLAFDQVYDLKPLGEDLGRPYRWLEMMDTRYTRWLNVGSESQAGLFMNDKGPYFEQA